MMSIYKGLIRARLDWGSMLYADSDKKSLLKMDRVQYAALRLAMGCIITTPTNILLHLAAEPTLEYRRTFLTKKFLLKSFSDRRSLLFPKLQLMSEKRRPGNPNKGKRFQHSIFKQWL